MEDNVLYKDIEEPNKIYKDTNGVLYSRGEYSGDYYREPLPKVIVLGMSPLIGYMIADRFLNLVLPVSPYTGMDLLFDIDFYGGPKSFKKKAHDYRYNAVADSAMARYNRGDLVGYELALDDFKNVDNIGTVGCINTVTTPFVNMFGDNYSYVSNRTLYNDTLSGKSPYTFVVKDLSEKNLLEDDPNRPGFKLIDRINRGDVIQGINPTNKGEYFGSTAHSKVVVDVKRDKLGHIKEITTREDYGGGWMPSAMHNMTKTIDEKNLPIIFDHALTNVYRVNIEDANKYIKEHPEEAKRALLKFISNKINR